MEFNEEEYEKKVYRLAEILRIKDLNENMKKVQDYSRMAEKLIKENPNLTADELGELYEQQMELAKSVEEQQPKLGGEEKDD